MTNESEPIDEETQPTVSPEDEAELRTRRRLALGFAIGGGVLMLAGFGADVDAALGPVLHFPPDRITEAFAGTGVGVLGLYTTVAGLENFLDSWRSKMNQDEDSRHQ